MNDTFGTFGRCQGETVVVSLTARIRPLLFCLSPFIHRWLKGDNAKGERVKGMRPQVLCSTGAGRASYTFMYAWGFSRCDDKTDLPRWLFAFYLHSSGRGCDLEGAKTSKPVCAKPVVRNKEEGNRGNRIIRSRRTRRRRKEAEARAYEKRTRAMADRGGGQQKSGRECR